MTWRVKSESLRIGVRMIVALLSDLASGYLTSTKQISGHRQAVDLCVVRFKVPWLNKDWNWSYFYAQKLKYRNKTRHLHPSIFYLTFSSIRFANVQQDQFLLPWTMAHRFLWFRVLKAIWTIWSHSYDSSWVCRKGKRERYPTIHKPPQHAHTWLSATIEVESVRIVNGEHDPISANLSHGVDQGWGGEMSRGGDVQVVGEVIAQQMSEVNWSRWGQWYLAL